MTYDAIIIGAGPAGSTAAIQLAKNQQRVLLLEKSRFPREKLCGEFLTPECLNIFDSLGICERLFDAGARIIRHFRLFAPDGRSLEVPMEWMANGHPHAISLTRAKLDWLLLQRAREVGVDVREGFHVSPRLTWQGNLSVIEGKADGLTTEKFAATLVIDASGRNGVFSNQNPQPASRFAGSRLFGCKVHLRGVEGLHELGELYFFGDGYGGLTEVEGDRVNLCFLTTEATLRKAKGDRQQLLDLTLRSNQAARRRLQSAVVAGEWLGAGPIIYGRRRTMPGVLAIGDANAFIDPFTGSGMLLAFTAGKLAAAIINEAFGSGVRELEAIRSRYEQQHRAQFGWRFRASSMLRGVAFKPMARNAMVTLLSRHQGLMKLAALSTRQRALKIS